MSRLTRAVRFSVNNHFYDFIDDWESKYYFLVGGYGSSKSYHVAIKLIKKLLQEKRKALVVREVYETIRESCFDLLQEVVLAMGFDEDEIIFTSSPMQVKFPNGSKIIFKGMDNPAKLKSLNGVSIIWLEECSEVKYEGFKELKGRLRHPTLSNHIILSTNPVSKGNWCYKEFFEDSKNKIYILKDTDLYNQRIIRDGKTYYHHSTVDDNFFVPKDYIETLDDLKNSDPDLYRIARKGMFGANGLLVFPQFEVKNHNKVMEEIKKIKNPLLKNGMDFGFITSYNAILRMAIDHDNKILYLYWEYYSKNKTDPEIAEDIKEFIETQELIKADNAEPKAIRYYKQKGFRIKACKKFKGSRAMYTKKVKRFNKIICSDICVNTIEELKELTFKVDKRSGEIIEDEFNIDPHTLSAIWYGLDDYEVSNLKGSGLRNFGSNK
ncbi:PBSX family phage terminase large subunit [Clostridium chauvoei]|uniref:PBSX family phage terminase large subunit n=2 Tax=Clostridium chauvoei TaxID=46867 RepID=A0ABD4RH98_9CLOT|nr:PBSX family phage terminase large subunit [Clostridium chauvoei]ATD55417.1 terminase [Clostridium chauvoei]ATD56911.1 terminase [Clostridium chauvoei]MBX7280752.1 PBSX family phage terminase large subunit [Clostridium chauvoei]MBX7283235.1 PBSX family phage terminase large subunit [Clostridium chauvoei]MBX7285880.1 PBSX family phage terminase large subunit [Clostridium chauvoei]